MTRSAFIKKKKRGYVNCERTGRAKMIVSHNAGLRCNSFNITQHVKIKKKYSWCVYWWRNIIWKRNPIYLRIPYFASIRYWLLLSEREPLGDIYENRWIMNWFCWQSTIFFFVGGDSLATPRNVGVYHQDYSYTRVNLHCKIDEKFGWKM